MHTTRTRAGPGDGCYGVVFDCIFYVIIIVTHLGARSNVISFAAACRHVAFIISTASSVCNQKQIETIDLL